MSQKKTADVCMNSMFFFDDWMLQAREGLDRVQGQPVLLADVTPELPEHLSRLAGAMACGCHPRTTGASLQAGGGDGRYLDVL